MRLEGGVPGELRTVFTWSERRPRLGRPGRVGVACERAAGRLYPAGVWPPCLSVRSLRRACAFLRFSLTDTDTVLARGERNARLGLLRKGEGVDSRFTGLYLTIYLPRVSRT